MIKRTSVSPSLQGKKKAPVREHLRAKSREVIIVGVKLNPESRELLTWTLAKFANPGNRVIALHVALEQQLALIPVLNKPSTRSKEVDNIFDSVMGVYDGFCNTKHIDLQFKVANGSSLDHTLIEETKRHSAIKLILGTTGTRLLINNSFSLADFCSNKLPSTCSVLVIQHGQVVYEQPGALKRLGDDWESCNSNQGSVKNRPVHKSAKNLRENQSIRQTSSEQANCGKYNYDWISPNRFLDLPLQSLHPYKFVPPQVQPVKSTILELDKLTSEPVRNAQLQANDYQKNIDNQDVTKCNLFQSSTMTTREFPVQSCFNGSLSIPRFDVEHKSNEKTDKASPTVSTRYTETNQSTERKILHCSDSFPAQPTLSKQEKTCTRSRARKVSLVEWAFQLHNRPRRLLKWQSSAEGRNLSVPSMIESENILENFATELAIQDLIREKARISLPSCLNLATRKALERCSVVCRNKSCMVFDFLVLQIATRNFSKNNIVGRGGCSLVYKGELSDGRLIAVKHLSPSSISDLEEVFLTEIEVLSGLQHDCIVKLLGYCINDGHYYLVYNFASEGNLEQKLHDGNDNEVLAWHTRYKIAIRVAEALEYIHSENIQPIIHRDVKSANILLLSDFTPQLTDFGLSKWAPTDSDHLVCNEVVGSFGYIAPEYLMYGKVNLKTDVYSFGVVLLELISGKHPIKSMKQHDNLVIWARTLLEDEAYNQLVDQKLKEEYDIIQVKNMMRATSLCLRQAPNSRPCMSKILQLLKSINVDQESGSESTLSTADDEYDMPVQCEDDIRNLLSVALHGVND